MTPADEEQCQTFISFYRPFTMGGPVRGTERCTERPSFIATEKTAGPDGQKGSMSLCPHCKEQLVKQFRAQRKSLPRFTVIDRNPKRGKKEGES